MSLTRSHRSNRRGTNHGLSLEHQFPEIPCPIPNVSVLSAVCLPIHSSPSRVFRDLACRTLFPSDFDNNHNNNSRNHIPFLPLEWSPSVAWAGAKTQARELGMPSVRARLPERLMVEQGKCMLGLLRAIALTVELLPTLGLAFPHFVTIKVGTGYTLLYYPKHFVGRMNYQARRRKGRSLK